MKRKGQVFSGEFILGYFIFMVTLIFALYLWNTNFRQMTHAVKHREIYEASVSAGDLLVKTKGSPVDWDRSNVHSFGIVNVSRIIDREKVVEFMFAIDDSRSDDLCSPAGTSNYECSKYLLTQDYEFWINITDLEGVTQSVNNVSLSSGRFREVGNFTYLFTIQRNAVLDDEIVRVNMEVYK